MLAVINDEKDLSMCEKPAERMRQTLPRLLAHAKRRGNRLRHEGLVSEWRQVNPPDTVVEPLVERTRHLQSEARFTRTAGADQRQQTRQFERLRDVDDFALPAHQARQSYRQICVGGLADKAVAEAMRGFDESRGMWIVTQRIADFPDADLEHRISHGRVRPDRCQQLVLRDKAPGACNQMFQHRKRFRS